MNYPHTLVVQTTRVFIRPLLIAMLFLSAFTFLPHARAEGIQIKSADLELVDETNYQVNAEFEIILSGRLEEAIAKGVPVSFIVEFGVVKPRWYWLEEELVKAQQVLKLSYNALTRQYQLSAGPLHKNFSTLAEAKSELGKIREWTVFDRALFKKNNVGGYEAILRMRVDVSQLPKPLQVNALASRDWSLDSDWHRWPIAP